MVWWLLKISSTMVIPPPNEVWRGYIGISVMSVGRAGGRSVANLASRTSPSVFDQFPWNFAQKCALGCRCARHIFPQWQKVCCHGNGILWAKMRGNLASRTSPSVFVRFPWNFAQKCALGCRCARHIFQQWRKVCCHGNKILLVKMGGKTCVSN